MDGGAADLDSDGGVQDTDRSLEGLEAEVLVGEDAVLAAVDAERNADGDVVLIGAEPGVTLGLLEYVVEEGVVAVVIHGWVHAAKRRAEDYEARTAAGRCARRWEGRGRTVLGRGGKARACEELDGGKEEQGRDGEKEQGGLAGRRRMALRFLQAETSPPRVPLRTKFNIPGGRPAIPYLANPRSPTTPALPSLTIVN